MTKFIVNDQKDDSKYQVHHLGCPVRPLSDFFYVEALNMDSAIKKAEKLRPNRTYYACKSCG